MSVVNAIVGGLLDAVLYAFRGMHPLVGLTVLALPVSVGMLLVFKRTSNQKRIAEVKNRIQAGLFEIRLFNDDLRAIFRAQSEILRHNVRYLGYSLVPLVWMIAPFVLLIGQLQYLYGYRGLEPGEAAVLQVRLAREAGGEGSADGRRPAVQLEVPEGVEVQAGPVWIPSLREVAWRIAARERGDYEVRVLVGGEGYTKKLSASPGVARRSPERLRAGFFRELLHPAERPLPRGAPLESISVRYPESGATVLDLSAWVWAFFGITIVFAFALRGRFGVTI